MLSTPKNPKREMPLIIKKISHDLSFNQLKVMFFKFISVDYYRNLVKSEMEFPCCNYAKRVLSTNLCYRISSILFFADFTDFL